MGIIVRQSCAMPVNEKTAINQAESGSYDDFQVNTANIKLPART